MDEHHVNMMHKHVARCSDCTRSSGRCFRKPNNAREQTNRRLLFNLTGAHTQRMIALGEVRGIQSCQNWLLRTTMRTQQSTQLGQGSQTDSAHAMHLTHAHGRSHHGRSSAAASPSSALACRWAHPSLPAASKLLPAPEPLLAPELLPAPELPAALSPPQTCSTRLAASQPTARVTAAARKSAAAPREPYSRPPARPPSPAPAAASGATVPGQRCSQGGSTRGRRWR